MTIDFEIPHESRGNVRVFLESGEPLYVVGVNGSGKSALLHKLGRKDPSSMRRISAHRQSWFVSNTGQFTAEGRRNTENTIQSYDTSGVSRWKDEYAQQRANRAIYDLLESTNVRARQIVELMEAGDLVNAQKLSDEPSIVSRINNLFRLSNIPIVLSIDHKSGEILAQKRSGPTFSIAELSDGERSALLLAVDVLTVPPETVLLIDEPERHLHRSIITPLLRHLFMTRSDCYFIVSTHEPELALASPGSVILVRECNYQGEKPKSWDFDILEKGIYLDEESKRGILGSRRKLLFVEGAEHSLDFGLYSMVFPGVSIIPKGDCRQVESAVNGLRNSTELHWIAAFGLIDNDQRSEDERARLAQKKVFALDVFSVESIYYHPEIQKRIAERQALNLGLNQDTLLEHSLNKTIEALLSQKDRLCLDAVSRHARHLVLKYLPKTLDGSESRINIPIDVQTLLREERMLFDEWIEQKKIAEIFSRYPIRETSVRTSIALELRLRSTGDYEQMVRTLLLNDSSALSFVKSLFSELCRELAAAT